MVFKSASNVVHMLRTHTDKRLNMKVKRSISACLSLCLSWQCMQCGSKHPWLDLETVKLCKLLKITKKLEKEQRWHSSLQNCLNWTEHIHMCLVTKLQNLISTNFGRNFIIRLSTHYNHWCILLIFYHCHHSCCRVCSSFSMSVCLYGLVVVAGCVRMVFAICQSFVSGEWSIMIDSLDVATDDINDHRLLYDYSPDVASVRPQSALASLQIHKIPLNPTNDHTTEWLARRPLTRRGTDRQKQWAIVQPQYLPAIN